MKKKLKKKEKKTKETIYIYIYIYIWNISIFLFKSFKHKIHYDINNVICIYQNYMNIMFYYIQYLCYHQNI